MQPEGTDPARPACYGELETVFPMGAEGLREVRESCQGCGHKVACLRQAVSAKPAQRELEEERQGREEDGGVSGFIRRWARLKDHSRREGGS